MSQGTPAAEVAIDEHLARALLRDQHPDLAELPLRPMEHGWDNAMFRLGDALALRMPRRRFGAAVIANEQRWLPELATRLPIDLPVPLRVGEPGRGYPWRFSVVRYLPGEPALRRPPRDEEAARLADFLLALGTPAPDEAPSSNVRGLPLQARAAEIEGVLATLEAQTDAITPGVKRAFADALVAPTSSRRRWVHGDLHGKNVLVGEQGRLSGIIDWGDLNGGDVATDLAAFFILFERRDAREAALERYLLGAHDGAGLLERARGWAVALGALLLRAGLVDDPGLAAMGRATLERVAS